MRRNKKLYIQHGEKFCEDQKEKDRHQRDFSISDILVLTLDRTMIQDKVVN